MAALTTDQILDAIASMTVLEASELVKAMEENVLFSYGLKM